MRDERDFDTACDFWEGVVKDPDAESEPLREYHQRLWSKPLPNGELFDLDIKRPLPELRLRTSRVECNLTSDSIGQTWSGERWRSIWPHWEEVIPFIQQQAADFRTKAGQIGGKIVFPSTMREGKDTINRARGKHPKIKDRFDLTLECIRLHYRGVNDLERNPLGLTLARYEDFFDLFETFQGYIQFFLLDDLVMQDYSRVKLLMRFDRFGVSPPLPRHREEYLEYRQNLMDFVDARNQRMDDYIKDTQT
jgi:hypothetical protein